MKVKELIAILEQGYPADAETLISVPVFDENYSGEYLGDEAVPVTGMIHDEKRNTIELVAD
jgi:hypothetical protein